MRNNKTRKSISSRKLGVKCTSNWKLWCYSYYYYYYSCNLIYLINLHPCSLHKRSASPTSGTGWWVPRRLRLWQWDTAEGCAMFLGRPANRTRCRAIRNRYMRPGVAGSVFEGRRCCTGSTVLLEGATL